MSQEEYIAEQCKKGDRNAQRQLYERYAGWLLGVCLRYAGRQDIAEDLLQDGFIHILTHMQQFHWQGEGSLKAWMFRVQQNIILQYIRKKEDVFSLDDNPQLAQDIPEPENVNTIPRGVLLKMISELPLGYRTVFNLFVIDGLSHREIAQKLGIKEKSSASQLVHARRLLAEQINNWKKENL